MSHYTHELNRKLNKILTEYGLECHPFKVGWYNDFVKPEFSLAYDKDTVAFTVISAPSFFEKTFLPYINKKSKSSIGNDLLDQSIKNCLQNTLQMFPDISAKIIYDYEMRPGTRRPKVLVQTAGHVSGAAYFYQKTDVYDAPWGMDQIIHGVCLHSSYVGWFALRAVIVFEEILAPDLKYNPPKDILEKDREKIIEVLNLYNKNWQDWSFRDIVQPSERYSEIQQEYFSTKPAERNEIVERIKFKVR